MSIVNFVNYVNKIAERTTSNSAFTQTAMQSELLGKGWGFIGTDDHGSNFYSVPGNPMLGKVQVFSNGNWQHTSPGDPPMIQKGTGVPALHEYLEYIHS